MRILIQVKITQRILKAQDRDDPPESLEYSIQYPKAFDIGYFEITDSLGVRARITSFTQKDVNEGRIKYVHRWVLHDTVTCNSVIEPFLVSRHTVIFIELQAALLP